MDCFGSFIDLENIFLNACIASKGIKLSRIRQEKWENFIATNNISDVELSFYNKVPYIYRHLKGKANFVRVRGVLCRL